MVALAEVLADLADESGWLDEMLTGAVTIDGAAAEGAS